MHCGGNYLVGMKRSDEIQSTQSAPSYLITGGCDLEGKVPILEHMDLLRRLPENSTKIAHTGLMDGHDAESLSEFIDVISFDFVGDNKTIKEIYGLDKSVQDYVDSYDSLSSRIPTFPHLTIGLYKGELAGEYEAIEILKSLGTKSVVLNVFMPTSGTGLENVTPPPLDDVRGVVRKARRTFENVHIGCMRPGGSYRKELDVLAVEEGSDRIVNPTKAARDLAKEKNLSIDWKEECCIL